jgi:hypothetical protein
MAFNTARAAREGPVTHEGGRAFKIGAEHELYLLVVSSLMSGDTFYESGGDRLDRFRGLVGTVSRTPKGRDFLIGLVGYARDEMFLRTTPTLIATELFLHGLPDAGAKAAFHAWVRGDEHLEALAYLDAVGAKRQKAFLKAVADRLMEMDEYQFVKYSAGRKSYSQKDAIRLSHPVPKGRPDKSALFKYVVHGWDKLTDKEKEFLPTVAKLKDGGETLTWEQHISKHGSSSKTWTEAVEKMGYMALLRNLRNFVEKGIPSDVMDQVATKIADPEQVAKSKQLPFRFLSAYRALPANAPQILMDAVAKAADHGTANIPDLGGDSLVLVDTSASMDDPVSEKSTVTCADAAQCLGASLVRAGHCDLWAFGTVPVRVKVQSGNPVMATLAAMVGISGGWNPGPGQTGHGTEIGKALNASLRPGLKRIVVLTDLQSHDHATPAVVQYLNKNPETMLYIIDLRGYGLPCFDPDRRQVLMIGGFSDRVFQFIQAIETSDPVERIRTYGAEA